MERLARARQLFGSLELKGWREAASAVEEGGQAGVLRVVHEDGWIGAFRYLKRATPEDVKRFYRELKILTDPRFKHPSIVNILEWTKDEERQWYISEGGTGFELYWSRKGEEYTDAPEALVASAVATIRQIADGLALLHDEGVVHRDIKPGNLVIVGANESARPVLIDFGIAHIEGEERFTPVDAAVGNRRFSPDVMLARMEQVPPWLDVFQLAQVFIWMVSVPSPKGWSRPLDWRWVNYDGRSPGDTVLAIRAVTALCSEQELAPRNAAELDRLMAELFVVRSATGQGGGDVDYSQVAVGRARGRSLRAIERAKNVRVVESGFPVADRFYGALRPLLEELVRELAANGIEVRVVRDIPLDQFYSDLVRFEYTRDTEVAFEVECGGAESHFNFRVCCLAYLPSRRPQQIHPPPESSNIFAFFLQRYASLRDSRLSFPHKTMIVTIERMGELWLRDEQMNPVRECDAAYLRDLVRNWILEADAWAAIERDRRS